MTARGLLILFLIAAAVRVGLVLLTWDQRPLFPDEGAYLLSARSLAEGTGLIDEFGYRATYMPGYPAFLALFQRLENPLPWARLVQAILAAWVAPATMLLSREWLRFAGRPGSERTASTVVVIAGMFAAFNPFLVYFSGLLLTEALYAAVLISAWALVIHLTARAHWSLRRVVATGALLWACVMLRPGAIAIVLAAPVLLVLLRRDLKGLVGAGMLVLIVVIGLAPWAARNRVYPGIGRWEFLTTRGGISLYDGLQPGTRGESDLAHTKTMSGVSGMKEAEWDAHFRDLALQDAREDPARILRLAGLKFLRTWSLRPNMEKHREAIGALAGDQGERASWVQSHHDGASWVSSIWIVGVLLLAAVGWWTNRSAVKAWILLLAPVVITTLTHMVFVGSIRYRVPVMPCLFVLAAAGFATLIGGRGQATGARRGLSP